MAVSSSSNVNTDQTEIGAYRTESVPVQVTTIRLTKENYLKWSAAITMGIAGRGRIAYVNGSKVEPAANSMAWDTWFLEDNQVKTWIVNSVSSDIQSLILRKKTARDMWVILKQMYGQKKRKVRVYVTWVRSSSSAAARCRSSSLPFPLSFLESNSGRPAATRCPSSSLPFPLSFWKSSSGRPAAARWGE
ncbi:hypothetical protein EJ110_NYTH56596 [Nymphaea thermarum]|nr:hypothetical protein EJ110_NYTH56596 [Nymphaea thermarum]